MKKSVLNLLLFAISGAGFFALVLAVYVTDKALAGRLSIDLALINLGGAICRFGLDLTIIQKSDRALRFGLGDTWFAVPVAACLYSLVVLPGAQNVGLLSLTCLVATAAFNEILAAHLRNAGLHVAIYAVRICGFIPSVLLLLLTPAPDGATIQTALLMTNGVIVSGLYLIGYLRIARSQSGADERTTVRWLLERFTLLACLNTLTATLLAKIDVLVFATMLSDEVIGDYAIIKQTAGLLTFVAGSFNYRYASDVRRLWQSEERAKFRTKFWAHIREAVMLSALGAVVAGLILVAEYHIFDLPPQYLSLFAALLVMYVCFACLSPSGMYLTAMGKIAYQTARLWGSIILFLGFAYALDWVLPGDPLILVTYSAAIAVFQVLLFLSLSRMVSRLGHAQGA
jgi:O-antigen/teichoic acid export membrane protein